MQTRQRSVIGEGTVAGVLGATAVAVFFLIVDYARGRPFLVPAGLGHALLHAMGLARSERMFAHVAAYTVFHYAAFIALGIAAAALLRRAEREPMLMAAGFLIFAVLEIVFYLLGAIISEASSLGMPAWYFVAGGNMLAAIVMGVYFWRAHPTLGRNLDHALSGREDAGSSVNRRVD